MNPPRPMVLKLEGVGELSLALSHDRTARNVVLGTTFTLAGGMTFRRWPRLSPTEARELAERLALAADLAELA